MAGQSGNDNKGKKNPWGNGGNNNGGGKGPWGTGGPGGYETPPDLDEMLRKAQDNLRQVMPGGFGGPKIVGIAILAGFLLWLSSGLYVIKPGVFGVIQRFGEWNRTQTEEGLGYHIPWPVEVLSKVNVSEVRRMEIGFAETFSRGGATQKRDIQEESQMLTSDMNIVDLDMEVQWTIKSAEDFLFNIRDQENTIKKVAESAIREVIGQTPMFPIITKARADVARRAKEIMESNLDEYESGVNITEVLIQQAEVHPDVQNAFQDVQSAKQDAADVQNRADAYRQDILPKARGQAIKMSQEAEAYKKAVIARAVGDADRFESVYNAYLTGKDVTKQRIFIETMEDVLINAQKIIMDDSAGSGVVPYLPLSEMEPAASRNNSYVSPGNVRR
jgi:membrane protease subunit HflK